ncbi:MAG: SRPBCC family protein [Pseudomonadota bacterium]|nr:SRPBCC family protein [Pseudomonadota bacterium]
MRIFAIFLALIAAPASAVIVGADSHGFEVRQTIELPVQPAQALASFAQIGSWWSKDHTYSGNASRLSLELRPGGCWCEQLDRGGGVEHMRIALYKPGERIMLTGALGPLLSEAVSGVMDVTATKTGTGSRLTINYRAAGFARGNGTEMALGVDGVLREQAERLRTYASKSGGKR